MNNSPRAWTAGCGTAKSLAMDRPQVLAILNLTPDSFSDGGALPTIDSAVAAASRAIEDGASGLDVGGESTRPGSRAVSAEEQIRRTAPVIVAIRRRLGDGLFISIDTTRSEVAATALDAGADAVNDVSAGRDDAAMLVLVAERKAGVVLMHRLMTPARDVYSTRYAEADAPMYPRGVVSEVREFLAARVQCAMQAGVARERIVIDPGLGFGKTVAQNMELIEKMPELVALGFPVMSGLSRKSFVGHVSGVAAERPPSERLFGTVALSVVHFVRGARVFRVHDVKAHVEALRAAWVGLRSGDGEVGAATGPS